MSKHCLIFIRICTVVAIILMEVASIQATAQIKKSGIVVDSLLSERIQTAGSYFELNKFQQGFELIEELYKKYYPFAGNYMKPVLLELGIKLSFALDFREETLKYLNAYYDYSPTFSPNDLNFINPQLRAFIIEFLDTKNNTALFVNKHGQSIDFVPSSVVIYTREDIERLGARNLLDLIRLTSGFAELGDSNERLFGTRGTSSNTLQDIMILINGHRLNDLLSSTAGPDWISMNYVERVEILKGPGSVIFGGNAFSGVINVITKNGTRENWQDVSVNIGNGNNFQNLSLRENSYNLNYEWSKKFTNTQSLYFSGTFLHSGGSEIDYSKSKYKLVLPDDGIRAAQLNGKEYINRYFIGYDFLLAYNTKALQVTMNFQGSDLAIARPRSSNIWYSLENDSLRRIRHRLDSRIFTHLEYDFLNNRQRFGNNSLVLKTGFDFFNKDIYFPQRSIGNSGNSRLLGGESRATASLEFSSSSLQKGTHSKHNYFLAGVEGVVNHWFYNFFTTRGDSMILDKIGDHFSQDPSDPLYEFSASFYTLTEQHLILDQLVFTGGVRFNYNNQYATMEQFRWGQEFSPRFAAVFVPPADANRVISYKFKAAYNSAFLPPPFWFRRGSITLTGDGSIQGNDQLNSKTIESGELTLFGDVGLNDKGGVLHYEFSRFINLIQNEFITGPTGYINDLRAARLSGYDINFRYKFENQETRKLDFEAFANISLAKENKFKEDTGINYLTALSTASFYSKDSLFLYPRLYLKGGFNLIYNPALKGGIKKSMSGNSTSGLQRILLGVNAQYIAGVVVNSPFLFDTDGVFLQQTISVAQQNPDAFVINANLQFRWKKFQIGASVFNLTNQEYFLPAKDSRIQRQRAEGRMVYLNLKYNLSSD